MGLLNSERVRADVIALQPVADTTLIETAPGNNLGGATFFNAGTAGNGNRNRALMLFDLSSALPAGATITSAELSLDVVRQPASGQQNSIFSLRRVFQSWGEGVQVSGDEGLGQGAPALAGEAAWNYRFADNVLWSQPGGQAGVDFSSTISSSAFVGAQGDQIIFGSAPGLIADVQFWLDHPEANFGWMLKTESEAIAKTARGFASLESGFGPTLTIDFTTVPEPGVLSLSALFCFCVAVAIRRGSR